MCGVNLAFLIDVIPFICVCICQKVIGAEQYLRKKLHSMTKLLVFLTVVGGCIAWIPCAVARGMLNLSFLNSCPSTEMVSRSTSIFRGFTRSLAFSREVTSFSNSSRWSSTVSCVVMKMSSAYAVALTSMMIWLSRLFIQKGEFL